MSQPPANQGSKTALLLQKLREKRAEGGEVAARPAEGIPRLQGEGPWPLSFGQERMWLLDQMRPGTSAFNMPMPMRLYGRLDRGLLERALAEIERRHESLRTIFESEGGLPRQRILPPQFTLTYLDLSLLPKEEREREVSRLRDLDAAAPFDLARGPLFRSSLVRLAEEEHLLLQNFHHSIFDGWSAGIFYRELRILLEDFAAGRPSSLAEPTVQYADFAVWQRQLLQGELLEKQLAYWRKQLSGATPVLALPLDRPRLPLPERRGAFAYGKVDGATTRALRQWAIEQRSPFFPLLLTAFQVLLQRLCGQDDILIGIPVADRPRKELENTLGFFLTTLVIRNQIDGAKPFAELFRATRDTVLEARAHQLIPFEKLVLELQPERSTSQTPFFQVLFNFANLPDLGFQLPGLEIGMESAVDLGAKLDLNFYLFEAPDGLDLQLVYDADLFDRARMQELLRQYEHLLRQIARDPQLPAGRFTLRSEVAEPNLPDPRAALPSLFRGTIAERFSRNSAEHPEQIAVEDPWTRWSYAEVDARSAAVARRLLASGIGKGDVVAIWAHRSAALVEGLLGILRAGAAFVVFDPAYPLARLLDYLELSRPKLLLQLAAAGPLPEPLEAALSGGGTHLLPLSAGGFEQISEVFEGPTLGGDDLAYVAFTSGSTGKSKAILGCHASLTAFLPFVAEKFGLAGQDRHSLLSALSHDPLHRDVLMPLYFGATLVIPDGEELFSPGYLLRWVSEKGLTLLNLVPAMLQLLVQRVADGPQTLPALRRVFTVGDVLQRSDVDALYALAPNAIAINLYGSTETQRAVSYVVLPRSTQDLDSESELGTLGLQKASLPVGRGYDGVQLILLNGQGELTGVGEVGEIHMRSHYLARGYADAAQTRERFLANPWGQESGDRLYKTGDLGRYLPDGQVEFLGRADFQVKIRGFRIELQEIEAALAKIPAIDSNVVVVREDERGDKRLVAYFVPQEGQAEPTARELRSALGQSLPDYMVPSIFVSLRSLPLTQTGKLDRVALPPPPREIVEHTFKEPANACEEQLAALWSAVLGRENVGADDNFFELGGHSLLATQLLARIRDAFGVSLPLRALFDAPTVEGLAELVLRQEQEGHRLPPIVPVARGQRLPLSFSQQRLWFLDLLDPGSTAYLLAGAARLVGKLDEANLQSAFDQLVERHEALRTRIESQDGEGWQIIERASKISIEKVDLRSLLAAEREKEARRLAEAEVRKAMPLEAPSLIRLRLLQLDAEEHWLVLALHHIIADGWSIGILLRELSEIYAAGCEARAPRLPPLTIQPADVAVWERAWLAGAELERQLAFWRRSLAGAPPALDLPTDFPRPAQQTFKGARLPFVLPGPLAQKLRARGQEMGATFFMVLLTTFEILLARLAGQSTVLVGTPLAHRERTELEALIGFFANTLPLRLDVDRAQSFAAHVAQLRRTTLDAFAHQDLPFEKLVAELAIERDLARSPVFQVMFALQNLEAQSSQLGTLSVEPIQLDLGRSQFDLHWVLYDQNTPEPGVQDLGGFFEWNTDLFERATTERLAERLLHLLAQVAADPARPVGLLDYETAADRAERSALNTTHYASLAANPRTLVPQVLAAHAAAQPEVVALGLEGEASFTYAQLEQSAGRLARHLQRLGAARESLVGISIGRLPSVVLAQLATWQAGAAYLPLDPIYPPDRLVFMLEDSGAEILIVDSRGEKAPEALLAAAKVVVDLAAFEVEASGSDLAASEDGDLAWQPAELLPSALAYALYTSGSTGKPKGVLIPHSALANFLASMAEKPGLSASDRLLSVTTMSFDISGLEIWLPLWVGARVDLARRETLQDADLLAAVMERCETSVMQATPATWRLLLDGGFAGRAKMKALCGGEALPAELAERLLAKVGSLWNVYGPTETTIWSAVREVFPGERAVVVPLGKPIAGTTIHLLDAAGLPVPPGVAGELTIGGVGLARGYHRRPALSAEKFRPDALAQEPGSRLYHTGDLARLRPDGELEFLGRLDFQVKVRGYRIELGEIEAALESHPGVAQAVVVARSDGPSTAAARLVGYVRFADNSPKPEIAELQSFLRQSLPEYMVPTALVHLSSFPLTPNNKIDRRALPAPEAPAGQAFRAPESAVEKVLAAIWQEVLAVPRVGADDNFFTLGGDSILVIQVVTRARKEGLILAPRDLFLAPILDDLARGRVLETPSAVVEAKIQETQGIAVIGDLSAEDLADLINTFEGG